MNKENFLSRHAVVEFVAEKIGVPYADLIGRAKGKPARQGRYFTMVLMYENTDSGMKEIGDYMGGRTCQDVIYAYKVIRRLPEADPKANKRLTELRKELAEMREKKVA